MNKEKLLEEFDKRQKALRDEFISKLKDDKKEFELTYPEKDYWVYCVDGDTGKIVEVYYTANNTTDRFLFEHGYYFETKEEAEQHLKESKLIFKLKQWAKIHNEGWEPNWCNGEGKFRIDVRVEERLVNIRRVLVYDGLVKLPHFKTREIAQACIDEFGDEIKEVFC